MAVEENKLIDFLEQFTKHLYEKVELNPVDYEQRKKHLMEPALNLFKMIKDDCIKNDGDIGAMIYLIYPPFFKAWPPERENFKKIKKNRDFLLEYFGLTSEELRNRVRYLERKLERAYGEDWFAKAYFPSHY